MTIAKLMRGYEFDDALRILGLARRRSMMIGVFLPALGLLAAGAAIGAGVGLAFAPSSGRRFRQDMGGRLDHLRERVSREAQKQQTQQVNATA
jgi:gas vesicle protein